MAYAVVRLRAGPSADHDHKKTLESLRLNRIHHATLVPEDENYEGMLNTVEHHVTYGEVDEDTATALLEERGRIPGDEDLTDDVVDEHTGYGSIDGLAAALADEEADLAHLDGIKPVFRLAPARGGFDSKKRHFNEGGSLGYRGDAINDLLERMV